MRVLGLGGSNHDYSACLTTDGVITSGIEEERLNRIKYSVGSNPLGHRCWRYVLAREGLRLTDVDLVVADDTLLPTAYFQFRSRVRHIRHHQAHAASAFYPSPFERAAILVADGAGSLIDGLGVETMTLGIGHGSVLEETTKVYGTNWTTDDISTHTIYQAGDSDHSLGFMYKAASRAAGFVLHESGEWYLTEDGKTMGLAPYGTTRLYPRFREYLELLHDGGHRLHLKGPGGLIEVINAEVEGLTGQRRFTVAADVARAAQALLEEALLHAARELHRTTGLTDLCLAGGVALNCVATGRLLRETPFENVFVQPGAGDNGCAVGSALHGYFAIGGGKRLRGPGRAATPPPQVHAYLGTPPSPSEVADAVATSGLPHRRVDPVRVAAAALADGALVGWVTGGSEFGPRALGHRSMLADPRGLHTKDVLNDRVKHREWFRPFAPAVLRDHLADWFELDVDSPYMLVVAPVRAEQRSRVPAITHVDGTARIQTLTSEANGSFHALVARFYRLTGVPMVLNTSYNDRGMPIAETPQQAIEFFAGSDLDLLLVEDVLLAHNESDLRQAVAAAGDDSPRPNPGPLSWRQSAP